MQRESYCSLRIARVSASVDLLGGWVVDDLGFLVRGERRGEEGRRGDGREGKRGEGEGEGGYNVEIYGYWYMALGTGRV